MNVRYSKTKVTTTTTASLAFLLTAILVIASLASVGMMQTNNAAAAGNTIYKLHFRGSYADAEKTIQDGSITTAAGASAFTDTAGTRQICVHLAKYDDSSVYTDFVACGSASQLTIANGLNSATYSGTVTGFDYATGVDKTVTVNVDLTATGKVQTAHYSNRINTRDLTFVFNGDGQFRPASGSLNISGDLTFSTDDATGPIGNSRDGTIIITKV